MKSMNATVTASTGVKSQFNFMYGKTLRLFELNHASSTGPIMHRRLRKVGGYELFTSNFAIDSSPLKAELKYFPELNCPDCEAFPLMTLRWVRFVINYETRTLPHSLIWNGKQEVKTHQLEM